MLDAIAFTQVPPFADARVDLRSRINLLTGDNSAGKTFFLDLAWTALTEDWGALESWFDPALEQEPGLLIEEHRAETESRREQRVNYSFALQRWLVASSRGREERRDSDWSGPVLYLRASGEVRLWDPARDPRLSGSLHTGELATFDFTPDTILDGLSHDGKVVCDGIIRDWVSWQRSASPSFDQLAQVMATLSEEAEPLRPGEPTRVSTQDVRDFPTVELSYGVVPFTKASAGVKRILSLAYLLVWMWQEHRQACRQRKLQPTRQLLLLVDELECHLHPHWQRLILPALLKAIDQLTDGRVAVQLIITTHSPMVLASCEPHFDESRDVVWELQLQGDRVVPEEFPWHRRGDASAWLTSPVFNLKRARSIQAEQALEAAQNVLHQSQPEPLEVQRVTGLLEASLSDTDPFWIRWSALQ